MANLQIWDTGKGQVQTEFADLASTETTSVFGNQEGGHLSMDYTCMRWFSLEKKVWFLSIYLLGSLLILAKLLYNINAELPCSEEKEAWEFPVAVGDWWWRFPRVGCVCWPVEMEG